MKKVLLVVVFVFSIPVVVYFIVWGYKSMINRNDVCAQVITEACFLGKYPCSSFAEPCSLPPLWRIKEKPLVFPSNNSDLTSQNPDILKCIEQKELNIKTHNISYMPNVIIVGFTENLTRQELDLFLEKHDLVLRSKFKTIDFASVELKTGNLLSKMCEIEKDSLVKSTEFNTMDRPL